MSSPIFALIRLFAHSSSHDEWFSNENNAVLGVILLDKTDADYVSIVLERDEIGVFRLIDLQHSIKTIDESRNALISKMKSYSKNRKHTDGKTRKYHLTFFPTRC